MPAILVAWPPILCLCNLPFRYLDRCGSLHRARSSGFRLYWGMDMQMDTSLLLGVYRAWR